MNKLANLNSCTFQGTEISTGTILYSYEKKDFVKVTAVEDIAGQGYIRIKNNNATTVEEERFRDLVPLENREFAVLPTEQEAIAAYDVLASQMSQGLGNTLYKVFSGNRTYPTQASVIAEHDEQGIVRFLSLTKEKNIFVRMVISTDRTQRSKNIQATADSMTSKYDVGARSFLSTYFAKHKAKIESQKPSQKSINIEKSIMFLLEEKYKEEFELIDGYRQRQDGHTFDSWLEDNRLK